MKENCVWRNDPSVPEFEKIGMCSAGLTYCSDDCPFYQEKEKTDPSERFRKQLVELVKASGQEIIDRAEDLVGNGDMMVDFEITLTFHVDGQLVDECPKIELNKSYISKKAVDVLMNLNTEDRDV